ncbi:hypothetical protein Pla108_13530 [Botrimarina colliarenosi]|uniref:Uncharacterized protein n=1 Tax=Botrimarina colliarenosi TaxID=2528001 RepID=A0A5C6AN13_9BACT|nr:hypothetical protein [Botrimarina colliarenosi]TWU00402.1 hypothetical protein Pla108_13530 [Botrimarina colliarenosi]
MSRPAAASPRWMSWNGLVYYGETIGFVLAWITGIAAIAYSSAGPESQPRVGQVAAADVSP